MVGNQTAVTLPGPVASTIQTVAMGILAVFGILFWFDVIILIINFIESRINPTPGGRAGALSAMVERTKGFLWGILGVYLAIFFIIEALSAVGATGISFTQVFAYFFIDPIVNGIHWLITGKP